MKKVTLELGQTIEVLRGTEMPMIDGKPMTIGGLLLRLIPNAAVNNDHAVRLWRIAMEIDKAGDGAVELSDLDVELMKKVVLKGEQPLWVKHNLGLAFGEE